MPPRKEAPAFKHGEDVTPLLFELLVRQVLLDYEGADVSALLAVILVSRDQRRLVIEVS